MRGYWWGLRREQVGVLLAELGHLGGDDELAVALARVARKVLLVVILGGEEGLEGQHLGDDRVRPEAFICKFVDDGIGSSGLFGQGGEDGGAVLRAHVVALAVEGGGVVDGEEDVQDIGVGDLRGVKGDAHHLGVPGVPGAHLLVGGVGGVAAGIAGDHIGDAGHLVEYGLEAPETTAGEHGDFKREDGGFGFHKVIIALIG